MLSAGMLTALASAMTVRKRGLLSGSPPPLRAATVSSLMMRVNIFPRLASRAPFLCLMVCHLEWPDIHQTPENTRKTGPQILPRGDRSMSLWVHGSTGRGRPDLPHGPMDPWTYGPMDLWTHGPMHLCTYRPSFSATRSQVSDSR